MIDQSYGSYTLVCDICEKEVKPFDDFLEAVNYKKENGWKSREHDREWEDVCPECVGIHKKELKEWRLQDAR